MIARLFPPALLCFILFCLAAPAADLTRIERTIRREPTYQSKAPKYCLLVIGPEAKTPVWLVQDGGTLYVDRNGNGDLTEAGEKVAADKNERAEEGEYSFNAGDVPDGERLHKELSLSVWKLSRFADEDAHARAFLAQHPQARAYRLYLQMEMPPWKGAGFGGRVQHIVLQGDTRGFLQFADKPEDAPIIHFGGPWEITFTGRHKVTIGRSSEVYLGVGTPGLGPGTTAYIYYDGVIPETVFPILQVTYPPRQAGGLPLRERYELKHRC